MKQFLLVFLTLSSMLLVAQPAQFEEITCGTTASTQLNRYLEIDGFQPSTDDWAAVFDSDGYTVARGQVYDYVYDNCPTALGVSIEVYGDDGLAICAPGFGLNAGETFNLVVWDADMDVFYESSETLTFTASFAPFPGPGGDNCASINADQNSPFPVTFSALSARDLGGKVLLDYDAVHDNPAMGINYYRIKQVDFEGTFSFSGIIPVEVAAAQAQAVTVFPNPAATGFFNVNVGSDWQVDNVSVSVLATRQVMTTDLAAGIYLVRVEGGKKTTTKRLVIR